MTTSGDITSSGEVTTDAHPAATWASRARAGLAWSESMLERVGDHLNPILVKEARQALKSKQFTVTFSLLLICGWVWSLIGIISQLPDIYYSPSGLGLLLGYYFILAVPLMLIVPFTSFRSLAAEREDGTYELLSISILSSRQIVTGKLGSSLLQMMVYYSALAPCIAFTYMLRGLDLISIALLLFYTFCVSVLLSAAGLVFAGLSRARHWQSLISVGLLLGLVFVGFWWAVGVAEILDEGFENLPLDDLDFWMGQAAAVTAFATYLSILILVAAAQNSFESDNRSTRIRIALTVQLILYIGWLTYGWLRISHPEFLIVALIFAAVHWVVYGVLLTGESARLSPRVRRQLPQSFFGRVFLTWYNPGSGSGYLFAVSHLGLLCGLIVLALIVQFDFNIPPSSSSTGLVGAAVIQTPLYLLAYFVAYLGLSRLIIVAVPGRERYGLLLPTLIHFLVALAGSALPFVYESWRRRYGVFDYSVMQATNWLWTIEECLDNGISDPQVPLVVFPAAIIILLINLVLVRSEVEAVRVAVPTRVQADDLARQPIEPIRVVDPLADV